VEPIAGCVDNKLPQLVRLSISILVALLTNG
jgi:hypothetical protein